MSVGYSIFKYLFRHLSCFLSYVSIILTKLVSSDFCVKDEISFLDRQAPQRVSPAWFLAVRLCHVLGVVLVSARCALCSELRESLAHAGVTRAPAPPLLDELVN